MITSQYPKKESIGNPQFFSGRKRELEYFLHWTSEIPEEKSKSHALLATKKIGKTAILDRLYNMLFLRQGPVIPFFFSIREQAVWQGDFASRFYRSFLTLYLAFKFNRFEWVNDLFSLKEIRKIAEKQQMEVILKELERFEEMLEKEMRDSLWDHAVSAPHRTASLTGDFFVQILDEFQYFNKYVYADKNLEKPLKLAGSYYDLSESRIAPLLVTGSMIGWLREILLRELNPRFDQIELEPFSSKEAFDLFEESKGYFLEFVITRFLKFRANQPGVPPLKELLENASDSAVFVPYQTVGEYHFNLPDGHHRQFDILARAANEDQPSLLIESKYHQNPITLPVVEEFIQKSEELKAEIPNLIPIFYSISGFTQPAIDRMKKLQFPWSDLKHWDVFNITF